MRLDIARRYLRGLLLGATFKNLKRQRLYIFRNRQKDDRSIWQIKSTGYCVADSVLQYWNAGLKQVPISSAAESPKVLQE